MSGKAGVPGERFPPLRIVSGEVVVVRERLPVPLIGLALFATAILALSALMLGELFVTSLHQAFRPECQVNYGRLVDVPEICQMRLMPAIFGWIESWLP